MAQRGSEGPTKGNGISAGKLEESAPKDAEEKPQKQGPRKRVSQACDKCRARKDKCDGKKPACSTCISNSRVCSYDANVKKRGLPEGYVRGLEKLWGLAIRDVDEVEDNVLSALAVDEDSDDTPLGIWNDESTSEALVEIWRKSQIWRELEKLLSSQEPNIGDFKRKRVASDGPAAKRVDYGTLQNVSPPQTSLEGQQPGLVKTTWPDKRLEQRQPTDYQNTPPNSSAVNDSVAFAIRDYDSILSPPHSHTVSQGGIPAGTVECPELPSETWHLIDVYFSYTHPWLPIIEKHDLLKTSYQYSQNRSSTNPASGENAVLWATIAYAKFQHRSINNIPRALGALGELVWTAERMYNQARALIPNEEGNLELGHVQALLILTLANIGTSHYSRAWSLIGQGVRAAIELQLDKPLDPMSTALKTKSRSKHIFLGCFVIDTLVAARLGRRPHLRSNDIDSLGLIDEDGLEEWDPWTDCLTVRRNKSDSSRVPALILSTFNRLISILKILNDAVCTSPSSTNFQSITVLIEKLRVWSQSISPPLYLEDSESARSLLPHQFNLHNVYFTTLATSQLLSYSSGLEPANLESCTMSARHITDLLHRHSNAFGMLIVPPTYEYFVKTAYDVVHVIKGNLEGTHAGLNDWRHRLDICLDALEPAWPIFETFKTSSTFQSLQARRESQVAFDLISGSSHDVDTPMAGQTPQSFTSYEMIGAYSPQTFRPQTSGSQNFRGPVNNTLKSLQPHRSSFGQSSGHGMPQNPLAIYQNAHVEYGNLKSVSEKSLPKLTPPAQSFNIPTPAQPTQHRSLTMSSTDVDFGDPMFNELMRLDATEWAGNSYQSLVNLGFSDTDPANMTQDFYAFCQEPDPLSQIDVFQQLVNGANAEAMDVFDRSAFGGLDSNIGLGLGGFGDFRNGLGDGNDSIEEAGQILAGLRES